MFESLHVRAFLHHIRAAGLRNLRYNLRFGSAVSVRFRFGISLCICDWMELG
jgi:hypothetical protein